jgi:NAD(P)H-hydrate epimerase
MRVLNTEEIRNADRLTIDSGLMSAEQLMENAARACLPQIFGALAHRSSLLLFCGNGNNGGDGLVIARHVAQTGRQVYVVFDESQGNKSELFILNKQKLHANPHVRFLSFDDFLKLPFNNRDVLIVDAVFGTGLKSTPHGVFREWIIWMNHSGAPVVSMDIPSGCPGNPDFLVEKDHVAVKADITLAFQYPRLSFFVPHWRALLGKIFILPIGLLHPEKWNGRYFFVDHQFAASLIQKRNPEGHKGSFGHLFLAAGSEKYTGASILSCRASLGSGVGLVTAFIPSSMKHSVNVSCPEAIVSCSDDPGCLSGTPKTSSYSAVAIGPGMGRSQQSADFLKFIIADFRGPLLLDADALNILADHPTWLAFLPPLSVLTPHPGEFERLAGKSAPGPERWELLRNFSAKWSLVVVLKGPNSMVALPDGRIFFNGSGNAGMAKGGSGDVLAGLIGGLLAQGYSPDSAALLGVFIHGLAGDIAAETRGQHGMTALDIVQFQADAFRMLEKSGNRAGMVAD